MHEAGSQDLRRSCHEEQEGIGASRRLGSARALDADGSAVGMVIE